MAKANEYSIPPGLDLFETDPTGTFQDFSQTPIPGIFFGLFASGFRGRINFKGKPVAPQVLGTTDTMVLRKEQAVLPESPAVPLELVLLSLESAEPVKIRRLWWTELYDVCVGLSCLKPSRGEATFTLRDEYGGTFDSRLLEPHDKLYSTRRFWVRRPIMGCF